MPALFEQVKAGLKRAIAEGEYAVGGVLPSVDSLARRGGCSVGTVRRAVADLSQQGVLRPVQRRGTVVVRRPMIGRVAILHADDYHSNLLLGTRLYEALRARHVGVEFVPGGLSGDAIVQKLDELACSGDVIDLLVTLWPEASIGHAAALRRIPRGIAYSFKPQSVEGVRDWVAPDAHWMARDVVSHLLGLGHRNIAAVSGYKGETEGWAWDTCEAARHLVEVAGATFHRHELGGGDSERLIQLVRDRGVTAYWALNDHMALLAMNNLHRAGLRTPEDVTIIGRFDTPWSLLTQPTLTSVSIGSDASANALADLVIRRLAQPDAPPMTTLVRPSLSIRQTSLAPRG